MAATVVRKSGVIVPAQLGWRQRLAAKLVVAFLRAAMKTWRHAWIEPIEKLKIDGPVIFCVWHNRLPLALSSYHDPTVATWPYEGLAAMISASRDGSFLSHIAEAFDVRPVRGSSSRRGPQALLEAVTWMEKKHSIVITPDGPRGPLYHIHEGIIVLAQLTGRPIIPTSNYAAWKIRLRSWDRFQIPLPFSRCDLRYGDPIYVPREASDAEREQLRLRLREAMLAITRD